MTYFNNLGQGRVGWRSPGGGVTPSSLWTSVYAVYNADSVGSSSLKTSLFAAYNGESNANDSFGTNNGTPQGGLTYTAGKIGNAFTFNGTTAYVSLPNNMFNTLTGDFSVSLWLYRQPLAGGMLVSNWYNGSTPYGWYIYNTNGVIKFLAGNGTSSPVCSLNSSLLTSNVWNFVTVTKTATSAKIYINGVLNTSATLSSSVVYTTTHYPMIGAAKYDTGLPTYFSQNGDKIDAVNVWNKELTSTEITELYNSGNGAQYITDSFYKPTTNDALNTYNGTPQGGLTYGVGKVGTAFQFNGTTAYVSLPDNSMNSVVTGDFTVSLWVYLTSVGGSQTITCNMSSPSVNIYNGWELRMIGSTPSFKMWNNISGALDLYGGPLSINTWYHIVLTRKYGTRSRIYINSALSNTNVFTPNPINSGTFYPSIGTLRYDGVGKYNYLANGSKVDTLNVWNKELTQSEITELYNSGNGKQYPN